jgi:hypothetical protein
MVLICTLSLPRLVLTRYQNIANPASFGSPVVARGKISAALGQSSELAPRRRYAVPRVQKRAYDCKNDARLKRNSDSMAAGEREQSNGNKLTGIWSNVPTVQLAI